MTGKDAKYVQATIDNEGFDYAFVNYSDFEGVNDIEFHRLRREFLAARKALADYMGIEE